MWGCGCGGLVPVLVLVEVLHRRLIVRRDRGMRGRGCGGLVPVLVGVSTLPPRTSTRPHSTPAPPLVPTPRHTFVSLLKQAVQVFSKSLHTTSKLFRFVASLLRFSFPPKLIERKTFVVVGTSIVRVKANGL